MIVHETRLGDCLILIRGLMYLFTIDLHVVQREVDPN